MKFNSLSVATRMTIIGIVPLIMIIILSYLMVSTQIKERVLLQTMKSNIVGFNNTSHVIGDLQRERGKTALFLVGNASFDEITTLRQKTDDSLKEFALNIKKLKLKNTDQISELLKVIESMPSLRSKYNTSMPELREQEIQEYTDLINQFISIEKSIANTPTTRGFGKIITSVIILEIARENAGLLRAQTSSLLARNSALSENEIAIVIKHKAAVEANIDSPALALSQKSTDILDTVRSGDPWKEVNSIFNVMLLKATTGEFGIDGESFWGNASQVVDGIADSINQSSVDMNASIERFTKEITKTIQIYLIILVITILATSAIIYFVAKAILHEISRLTISMKDIAEGEGDLTRKLEISGNDEFALLAGNFNIFIERIHALILEVKDGAINVSAASEEISASAEELASTSEQQSEQAQTVAAALNQLATTSSSISDLMSDAKSTTEKSTEDTNLGSSIIQKTIDELTLIDSQAKVLSGIIANLVQSTDRIGSIITVIDDIADQTNLLALNAAIEAARAGEAGKGFAVVADEVRKLAEKTADATKEIVDIIKKLQNEAGTAGTSMDNVTKEVKNGVELGKESLAVLDTIVKSSDKILESTATAASAVLEESATIEEINGNIHSMAAASDESSKAVHEVAKTSEELARQAEQLKSLVDKFKTDETGERGLAVK